MFLVGLTGGIGCGKSTVSKVFLDMGVPVIDADHVARQVVEPGQKAWEKIREEFGPCVIGEDGHINRKLLGQLIFEDKKKRVKLNDITHPEIAKQIGLLILRYLLCGHQFVIIDSPLLFEVNTWIRLVHKVIVVSCSEELQLKRIVERDAMSEEDARSRMRAQMSTEEKCKRANYVIHNDGHVQETRRQTVLIYEELRSLKTHWVVRCVIGAICAAWIVLIVLLLTFLLNAL